jgi:DNA damage-binding protein 1
VHWERAQDLSEGPWRQSNLDAGASMIIPVPAPMGGAIVLGESVVAYMGHGQQMKCTEITPTIIRVRHRCPAAPSSLVPALSACPALHGTLA